MQRDFVVSDIHGCYKTFRYLVEEILQPTFSDGIYLLGDYINKGPSSRETLDYILRLIELGYHVFPLMGNHEKVMLDALDDPSHFHSFIEKGGAYTLKDFGVDQIIDIPDRYISFIRSLNYYYEKNNWMMVHAGFDFSSDEPQLDVDSMLNVRKMKFLPEEWKEKKIIHGHVPLPLHRILIQFKMPHTWNYYLDGGCVYPYREGMGFLIAFELNQQKIFIKECIDDVEKN